MNWTQLPEEILVIIFSKLDEKTLLQVAQTCKTFKRVSEDEQVWKIRKEIARKDCNNCCSCGFNHPIGSPDSLNKRDYFTYLYHNHGSCSSRPVFSANNLFHSLARSSRNKRVVVFGPGLDRAASNLIYDLMWGGERSPLVTVGLVPNTETHGVGGGIVTEYKGNKINFITLYRATKAEREALNVSASRTNRIIQDTQLENQSKMICNTADAIVYISDPHTPIDEDIRKEFDVLTNRKDLNVPILVLHPSPLPSPIQDQDSWDNFLYPDFKNQETQKQTPLKCPDVVDGLDLQSLSSSRRWWIYSFNPKGDLNLEISRGLDWLLSSPSVPSISSIPDTLTSLATSVSNSVPTSNTTRSFFASFNVRVPTVSEIQSLLS